MALPLAQADFLTHDQIMAGIVEETVEEDALFNYLPFEDLNGYKQVAWNRESTLPAESQYIGVNEEVAESTPTWSQQTDTLKILADRIEIDNFIASTKDAVQSIVAAAVASKGKQMMRKFHDTFYYGDASVNANQFSGLHTLLAAANTIEQGSGSSGAAGTLTELTQLATTIKPGSADALFMNRNMQRRLSVPYIANVQYNIDKSSIGDLVPDYAGIPIVVTDWLTMTEAVASWSFTTKLGGATTSIFAVKFGRDARVVPGTNGVYNNNGILGLQSGGMQIGPPHPLERKLGFSIQLHWYHTLILGSTLSLAAYTGLTDAALTV